MQIIEQLSQITAPYPNAVITIGNFDGVHIGHQALFHEVIAKADALGGTALAMTFEPHPLRVLQDNGLPPLITLYEQKAELIAKSGIDVLICLPFDRQLADISAEDFLSRILVETIGMKAVVVGQDYTFGKGRAGNLAMLKQYAPVLGYEVMVSGWKQPPGDPRGRISSTRVRELITDGAMDAARKMLGRHYQIRGIVSRGRNRGGRLLGFPTANINLSDELCPKTGVYAVTVELGGQSWFGVANIGYSPTFDDHQFTVEVHILDFKGTIYGDPIRVNFITRLREEIKFENLEALSRQIQADIQEARTLFTS
jgi:riboflavin kinase/FMN adenylyltransferase